MGEKDIAERMLLELPDVFADVYNVLYFQGKSVIRPEDLESLPGFSAYTEKGKLHKQERDVVKLWKPRGLCLALFGIENQTRPDPDMALRVMSYDAAAYRSQLSEPLTQLRFPVLTTVLFFGRTHWSGPKSLKERLTYQKELDPYINDFKINVAEVSFFTPEVLGQFKSDFGIIADYFVNSRLDRNYCGSKQQITHVREYFQLMKALTGDGRFDNIDFDALPKGEQSMYTLIDQWLDTGRAEGRIEGIATGRAEGMSLGIDKGRAEGMSMGIAQERTAMRKNIQMLVKSGQITEETAALLFSNLK